VAPAVTTTYTLTVAGPGWQGSNSVTIAVTPGASGHGAGVPGEVRTNPIDGAEMVWVPAGTFTMGDDDSRVTGESPASEQHVDGFWLYRHEVTNAQYATFVGDTGYREPRYWDDSRWNQPDQPVGSVNWLDAVAYCQWAGSRLPTETEWEHAARGGQQLEYATSTGGIGHDLANYEGTGGRDQWVYTSPVGSFPANPFGVYDMSGNAEEWCSTRYLGYPYSATDGREDMQNIFYPRPEDRTTRGGWCGLPPSAVRCACRRPAGLDVRSFPFLGFRCAQSPRPDSDRSPRHGS